jgi:hypothetical protein
MPEARPRVDNDNGGSDGGMDLKGHALDLYSYP